MTREEKYEIIRNEFGKVGANIQELADKVGYTFGTTKVIAQRMGVYINSNFKTEDGETWKDLSFLNLSNYRISSEGKVINKRGQLLVSSPHHQSGYLQIRLVDDSGNSVTKLIHVLVAKSFLEERPDDNFEIDHIDSDRQNPSVKNLQWLTREQNQQKSKRTKPYTRYLHESEVREICEMLEKGLSYSKIKKENSFYTKAKVEKIKQRKGWCEITKDYCY